MKRNQSGFTLIEIAIVLVIIGLLLGGVLKGQELINSAKVKNLASDFKNIPVYIYGFQDKYKALPGDDSSAQTHLATSGVTITNGNGSGLIDGDWDADGTEAAPNAESFFFWQHVRLAGFGPGATTTIDPDYIPKNTVGGKIGVTNAAQAPITGMKGTYVICSNAIAGKFAKQLDTSLDDSNTTTGSVMVAVAGTPAPVATTAIVDDTPYLVCMGY